MAEPDPFELKERLNSALLDYRNERNNSPSFYHNELLERGRAVARMRPVLEGFVAGTIGLNEFRTEANRQSRAEKAAAKGREQGRYWRFTGAGRLLLDSLYKKAESAGRLNALAVALQQALSLPGSLDEVEERFTRLERLWEELESGREVRQGLFPYFLSYFWALQSAEWPIYTPDSREALNHFGFLPEEGRTPAPANRYAAFYLAFSRLAQTLQLNTRELESFLHWWSERNSLEVATLVAPRKQTESRLARRRRQTRLEELREGLEARVQREISNGLRGVTGKDDQIETFSFQEIDSPVRLVVRLEQQTRSGVAFEGFSPAALAGHSGEKLLVELNGFLGERPEYLFYTDPMRAPHHPIIASLSNEFYLLREFPLPDKSQPESQTGLLLSEWRSLYPFARRISAPFQGTTAAEITESNDSELDYAYPVSEPEELSQVAEALSPYETGPIPSLEILEGDTAAEEVKGYLLETEYQEFQAARRDEAETRVVAHLHVPPLNREQMEGLLAYVGERLAIESDKVMEIVTHLQSGRNVLLYGPPGCGKTRLARLLAGQMCGTDPGWTPENATNNYTLATANAEWSVYEVIGGIKPGLAAELDQLSAQPTDLAVAPPSGLQYFFEPGVVARAALQCENSLRTTGRPHYLIIDEFNRANQDRAFGELFTLLEYRDRPLLPARQLGRRAPLYIPDAFRIIGTMNSDDRNTLFEPGMALRRRFALVEIDLPPEKMERRFLPKAVKARLSEVELTAEGTFADEELQQLQDKLFTLAQAIRPAPGEPESKQGGKKLGTALLIECLVFCVVSARFYSNRLDALEDAILADVLPQLDRAPGAINRALSVVSEGGPLAELTRVRTSLQRMAKLNSHFF